jgi:hypothetical protein
MYATLFDDPDLSSIGAAPLPRGHAGGDPRRRRGLPADNRVVLTYVPERQRSRWPTEAASDTEVAA